MRARTAVLAAALSAALATPSAAETTRARQAILVEHPGGRVLFGKAADKAMAPSSMTKLMTLYLAFQALEEKRVGDRPSRRRNRALRRAGAGDRHRFGQRRRGGAGRAS